MTPRGRITLAVGLSLPPALLVWVVLRHALPPIQGDPMAFALGCSGAVILLTLVVGVEAVAHERLFHASIDPLAGADSRRLVINQRYLQNTLEQVAVFVPALFLLAQYAGDLRVVAATAIVWTLGRWAFWIGYHVDPMWRGIGVFSMAIGLVALAYGVGAFGYALAGWIGTAALLAPLVAIETYLFLVLRRAGMSHFLLFYDLAPDYLARRPAFRDAHLGLAWAAVERGELLLGGAVGDPVESALLLFASETAACAFAAADPYVVQGLVTGWRVAPWNTVVGADAANPVTPQA